MINLIKFRKNLDNLQLVKGKVSDHFFNLPGLPFIRILNLLKNLIPPPNLPSTSLIFQKTINYKFKFSKLSIKKKNKISRVLFYRNINSCRRTTNKNHFLRLPNHLNPYTYSYFLSFY